MSWGVATQNGVSVSLASIVSLSAGVTEFSPADLFTGGVQGAWYDPSDVLLNWRTNLLTWTQEFDNAAWTKTLATVTPNDAIAPNGTQTADKVVFSGATSEIFQAAGAGGTGSLAATGSVYIKGTAGETIQFYDGYTVKTPTVLTGDWQRLEVPVLGATRYVDISAGNGATARTIWLWGAQLELGSTATAYQAITTPEQTYLLYDPQPVLYQDSAGTTPVTAVEQPVGLMLDKSQGLVLGSEATSGAWLNGYTTTFDTFTSTGPSSFTATTTGAKSPRAAVLANLPAAGWYWIEFTATFTGGSVSAVGVANTGSPYSAVVISTATPTSGLIFRTLIYTSAARGYLTVIFNATSASTLSVTGVSVKSLAGNHASQATAASRPVLRARYNQATYSEQVDNAAWTKGNIVTTGSWVNQLTAPDGTLTADLVRPTNSSTTHYALLSSSLPNVAGTYTCSLYVYAGGYTKFSLRESGSTGAYVSFDIATVSVIDSANVGSVSISASSIAAVAGSPGWYRAVVTYVYSTGITPNFGFWALSPSYTTGQPASLNWAGDGTSGIYIWGAQVVPGSSAGTYQRIAAATDYATAGFLPYLYFVTDDSFGTNSIDFSATDKMSVCAGLTKLSDAADGALVELSANTTSNAGSFYVTAPETTLRYAVLSRGSAAAATNQRADTSSTTYNAPSTVVLSGAMNISGDSNNLRLNGISIATATGDQGTGNYGNYPLYIGRRANTSVPFNGNLYQLIVCGKTLSASELASTEAYVATKTGVTL